MGSASVQKKTLRLKPPYTVASMDNVFPMNLKLFELLFPMGDYVKHCYASIVNKELGGTPVTHGAYSNNPN